MSEEKLSHYKTRNRNITLEQYIGNRIFLLRHAKELSLKDVSAKIGVSYQQLTKYEKGNNRVAASTLYTIANYYNVPIAFFYEGYEEKESHSNMTIEGIKTMNAMNNVRDKKSRKKIINHVIPIIKAFDHYYIEETHTSAM